MYLLLSGEGTSDIGGCSRPIGLCDCEFFVPGPMAIMIDQLVEVIQDFEFSYIDNGLVSFVHKRYLSSLSNASMVNKKALSLPGKKSKKETLYYRRNAWALAQVAQKISEEKNDRVLAVLFRDSDGTASSERGEWREKFNSMLRGFEDAFYQYGVPMLPKPKSEAWLLCAVKNNYNHCDKLEASSGNDDSPNNLKDQLTEKLAEIADDRFLNEIVKSGDIDVNRIDMPSFVLFKERLELAVNAIMRA